jgi:hypothetical protein
MRPLLSAGLGAGLGQAWALGAGLGQAWGRLGEGLEACRGSPRPGGGNRHASLYREGVNACRGSRMRPAPSLPGGGLGACLVVEIDMRACMGRG